MIVPSQLALKTHTNFGCAVSLATVASPNGDTSLRHVMTLATHSTTSTTPTAMGQSFIMTLYFAEVNVASESSPDLGGGWDILLPHRRFRPKCLERSAELNFKEVTPLAMPFFYKKNYYSPLVH
jgi:hypothetical protein